MFRIIIVAFIPFYFINLVSSQTTSNYNSELLEFEKKHFYESDTTLKNEILFHKLNYMIKTDSVLNSNILNEIKRIDYTLLEYSIAGKFLWNASIIAYLNNDYNFSLYYLKEYEKITIDQQNVEFLLLKTILYANSDEKIAEENIKKLVEIDSSINCLECLTQINNYKLKYKKFYGLSTLFIPGIYSFSQGKVLKGFTSLGLNIGTILVIRNFYQQQLYINMLTWGSNLIVKFYFGNRTLLEKQLKYSEKKEKEKRTINCTLQLNTILEKYPLILFSF